MSRARSGDAAGWRGRKMGGLRSSRPPRISAPERSTTRPPWPVASPMLPCPVPSQIARRLGSRRPHSHRAACVLSSVRSSPTRFDWLAVLCRTAGVWERVAVGTLAAGRLGDGCLGRVEWRGRSRTRAVQPSVPQCTRRAAAGLELVGGVVKGSPARRPE